MKFGARWLVAAVGVFPVTSIAHSPEVSGVAGSASIGADASNTDSRRIYASGDYSFGGGWSASGLLARADIDLPDTSAQSSLAGINVSYRLGDFTVGGGYRHGEIDGVSRSDDWLARGAWHLLTMRIGLEVGHRAATLDPSPFTEDLGGDLGVVSGISRCSVNGLGYRGSVDLDRPTWSGFASLRVFDYGDYDCALDIAATSGPPGNGNGNGRAHARGRALGHRLAAATLASAVGATSRLAPPDAALLESSLAIGFTTPVSRAWIGGVEIDRDVEKLDGSEFLTGILSASRELERDWTLELTAGYSLADKVDDSAFAGVRITRYFRH